MDYATLDALRTHHPAWRLLRSDHAPLIASFLHRAFVAPNVREEIDAEIARVEAGDVPLLDDTALKDRFQQFMQGARELLTDFREVEHNFRQLDRRVRVRERIALWEGSKGALLEEILGERDAIADLKPDSRTCRVHYDWVEAGELYNDLRYHRIREKLRLEQEQIGFHWVRERLDAM